MFARILIANRGEIACRIIVTCRRLGVSTVAVYSDADADARHVRLADEAVHIGGAAAADSYLDGEELIAVARSTGAEAVHPGYGFLAENADFAQACADAGLVFIGPSPDTIRRMGSKIEAKATMEAAGVPVVPGYHGSAQDAASLAREAAGVGYPLMIKAAAGGGGKGMRVVHDADRFAAALEGARREASAAFGDDAVLLERYVDGPRHVEFQVFGDSRGSHLHLFERECSVQRRFQKIIEETPSPALDDALRARMAEAAVAAAAAVDYVNAGTVEFILGADGAFYFMEMNTRLQVEHPVTECITGQDLVEWQLLVAAGEPLPLTQDALERAGHAIEMRLYAEDPASGFLPSVGRIRHLALPDRDLARVDRGVDAGDEVTIHYDPMIAKLIVHGADRDDALAAARGALWTTAVDGPRTNLSLLRRLLDDPSFVAGEVDTAWLDQELERLVAPTDTAPELLLAAALHLADEARELHPDGPWAADGWRGNAAGEVLLRLEDAGRARDLRLRRRGDLNLLIEDGAVICELADDALDFDLLHAGRELIVRHGEQRAALRSGVLAASRRSGADQAHHPGAPMPGRVVAVQVEVGQHVEPGDALVVMEGMKMEVTVTASIAGRVASVQVAVGDQVEAEAPLVDLEDED